MGAVPIIAIAAADARQVWPGAFGAPQEVMLINLLARHIVVAVAFGFSAEWAHHLRVTAHATFAAIDVSAFQFQS
ncbi:hypothetical protein HORIV_54560 [Vreelandella olivaria]|uniref:Uncharacterized protein n=1 Tax=Vreelandella olivaria TaxID=390919 RepID=A0ABM7GQT0_9GAMM|nr:hypothetical protein HORIV_54560 [Halomonas olivaria]